MERAFMAGRAILFGPTWAKQCPESGIFGMSQSSAGGAIAQILILGLAAGLDFALGDPWGWPHPVQGMGWAISRYVGLALKVLKSPLALRLAGVVLCFGLIGGVGLLSWGAIALATQLHPIAGLGLSVVLLASCFAGRSLRDATEDVLVPLEAGDLAAARSRLSRYVGRETATLDETEVLRAILETAAENAVDGVLAPLFYALLGALTPVGAAPIALAYKAASTLDSMVGYREAPYTDLGWCSARFEDLLTWLPCRLAVLTLAVLSGQPLQVWRLCWRDARADPSPNSGWSECAYAAALGVRLGGPNVYRGVVKYKPFLGDEIRSIDPEIVRQASQLTRVSFFFWLMMGVFSWIAIV